MTDEKLIRADIEVLRIISAFAIVCYHSRIHFCLFGLIIFLIVSAMFSGDGQGLQSSVNKRFMRIMYPWIFWSLTYGVRRITDGGQFYDLSNGVIAGILSSPSIHLWYLPYMFVILVVTDQIKLYVSTTKFSIACGVLSAATLLLSKFWRDPSLTYGYPWAQYIHGASAAFFGLFLASFKKLDLRISMALIALNMAAAIHLLSTKWGGQEYVIAYAIMILTVVAGGKQMISKKSLLYKISQCSFGIYLVHVLMNSVVANILHIHGDVLFPLASFSLSLCFVFISRSLSSKQLKFLF